MEEGYHDLTPEERRIIDARPKEPLVECPKHGFPEICPCGWMNPKINLDSGDPKRNAH